ELVRASHPAGPPQRHGDRAIPYGVDDVALADGCLRGVLRTNRPRRRGVMDEIVLDRPRYHGYVHLALRSLELPHRRRHRGPPSRGRNVGRRVTAAGLT